MRILTCGTFDVLTVGHLNLILYCRELAGHSGIVDVSLGSDDSIKKVKGYDRPVFSWALRVEAISAIRLTGRKVVDYFHMHRSNGSLELMIKEAVKPDIIVVGSDYRDKKVIGSEYADVKYFDRDWRFSSTKIIQACRIKKE